MPGLPKEMGNNLLYLGPNKSRAQSLFWGGRMNKDHTFKMKLLWATFSAISNWFNNGMNGCIKGNILSVNASFSLSLHYLFFTSLCNLIAFVYDCTTKKQRKGHISDSLKNKNKTLHPSQLCIRILYEDIHTISIPYSRQL